MAIVVERVPNRVDDLPVTSLDLNIYLDDSSVLGSDVLRLQSFSGTEGISQSFAFQLEIRANDYTFGGPTDIFRPPPETGTPSKRKNRGFMNIIAAAMTVLMTSTLMFNSSRTVVDLGKRCRKTEPF